MFHSNVSALHGSTRKRLQPFTQIIEASDISQVPELRYCSIILTFLVRQLRVVNDIAEQTIS